MVKLYCLKCFEYLREIVNKTRENYYVNSKSFKCISLKNNYVQLNQFCWAKLLV